MYFKFWSKWIAKNIFAGFVYDSFISFCLGIKVTWMSTFVENINASLSQNRCACTIKRQKNLPTTVSIHNAKSFRKGSQPEIYVFCANKTVRLHSCRLFSRLIKHENCFHFSGWRPKVKFWNDSFPSFWSGLNPF